MIDFLPGKNWKYFMKICITKYHPNMYRMKYFIQINVFIAFYNAIYCAFSEMDVIPQILI